MGHASSSKLGKLLRDMERFAMSGITKLLAILHLRFSDIQITIPSLAELNKLNMQQCYTLDTPAVPNTQN
jgi:hypothetical protein